MRRNKKSVIQAKAMVFSVTTAMVVLVASFVNGIIEDDEVRCRPQHVHIAYGDALDQIVIMWATDGHCSTMVEYTTSPWIWSVEVMGNSTEFLEQNLLGLHYLHRVKLSNLRENTTYYYRPFSSGIASGPFYFKTPRTDLDWSPRFLVFGDLGVHTHTIPNMVEEAMKGVYTAVIHAGDFAYNLKGSNGLVGDQFLELIQPVAAFLPYMTCPGNHVALGRIDLQLKVGLVWADLESLGRTELQLKVGLVWGDVQRSTAIPLPTTNTVFPCRGSPWPMKVDNLWYSFNVGPAHFISYSSEVFFTSGGQFEQKQFDWLVNDLRRANKERSIRPWIIAFGHRPMYCSANDEDDCTKNLSLVRTGLEDLFYGFGVDIVLQAHEHNYERLYPMYRGVVLSTSYVDPPAPVQIISGAAGSKHGIDPFQKPPKPDWAAVRVEQEVLNSFGRLQVVNRTHVYWEQVSVHSKSLLDSLWIVQHHHRKFQISSLPENISSSDSFAGVTLPDLFEDKDPKEEERRLKMSDTTQRIAIGASFAVLFSILLAVAILSRVCRRRHYTAVRRWEAMDLDYGKKLFTAGRDDNNDEEQDVEIDMGDLNVQSKKLLNNN